MNKALQNLVNRVGIQLDEALRMCSLYPIKALSKQNESDWYRIGEIAKGFKAKFVVLNEKLELVKLIE